MRSLLTSALVLAICDPSPKTEEAKTAEAKPEATKPEAKSEAAEPEAKPETKPTAGANPEATKPETKPPSEHVLAPYSEPWDPNQSVELEGLVTKTMYVVAPRSAICPTRAQAEARECGNSVELPDEGLRLRRGDGVLVVGDAPFDGHWRAIRYQVEGTLPSWIRADDLAERPILDHLDAFDERADVASAKAVDGLTSEEIYALGPGTLVKWTRKTGIAKGHERLLYPDDPVVGVVLYVPTKGRKAVALKVTEDPETGTYRMLHDNILLYGGLDLNYSCEAGSYCDEVSILARVRPNRAGPPELDEGESWPKAWKRYFMPSLDAVVLADRFDLWEFDEPSP